MWSGRSTCDKQVPSPFLETKERKFSSFITRVQTMYFYGLREFRIQSLSRQLYLKITFVFFWSVLLEPFGEKCLTKRSTSELFLPFIVTLWLLVTRYIAKYYRANTIMFWWPFGSQLLDRFFWKYQIIDYINKVRVKWQSTIPIARYQTRIFPVLGVPE